MKRPDLLPRPEGYEKLPKRFRDYLDTMESRLHALHDQVPARQPDDAKNYVEISDALHTGQDGYLPAKTRVAFIVDGVEYRIARGDVRQGVSGIEVMTIGGCVVYPRVSNVVVISSGPL